MFGNGSFSMGNGTTSRHPLKRRPCHQERLTKDACISFTSIPRDCYVNPLVDLETPVPCLLRLVFPDADDELVADVDVELVLHPYRVSDQGRLILSHLVAVENN